MSIAYKSSKLQGLVDLSASAHVEEMEMAALKKSVTSKFRNDYCGLPPYSIHLNPLAIAYKSRAPAVQVSDPEIEEHTMVSSRQTIVKVDNSNSTVKKNNVGNINKSNIEIEDNNIAQKKVALALLTMVKNEHLVEHFMGKGGLDAVLKLIGETRDIEVQLTCAYCLIEASYIIDNCLPLLKSNVFGAIQTFIESNNDDVRNAASQILANLTIAPGLENLLIQSNIVTFLQIINNQLHRVDTMCFLLLALCNIANAISLPEMAEIVMRICTIISQKLDVMKSLPKAKFISDMYCNYSRLHNYSSRLVEEGVMPLLLLMMDTHPNDNVIDRCSEVLANLSLNRKYRREISSSGIGSRLTALFNKGSPSARSSILLLTGNLLSSNLFHDKVANQVTLANILGNLFDLNHPAQFNTVAYCLCQLSRVETSCQVVVECGAVPMILNYLTRSPPPESLDYLWTVLTDITSFNDFIEPILAKSSRDLVLVLYEESINKASKPHQLHCVVQISFNISRRPDLSSFLSFDLIESLVKALKNMFALTSSSSNSSSNDNEYIQMTSLSTLININHHCREARACTLGSDLIDLFEKNGLDNGRINVKYIGLLNIVSNEENCCYHMLEMHVQKFIVSLQESFIRLVSTVPGGQKQKAKGKKKSSRDDDDDAWGESSSAEREYNAEVEGELGKELSAATLNNLAMKRPNGAPGVLSTLLTLAKNCKTMRVLYCIRSLAHMSVHMKAKVMLSKEARKIIPMLTVVMRCGCEEAERVQHYCSITLCNMLTTPIEKGLLLEFSKSGAIVDLVVVTMLRINATDTKEVLGKVFFNLLNRPEIREILVVKLDLLSSILELTKVEHIGLLEICIHAIYNVTCELIPTSGVEDQFAEKLKALKMPRFMINKLNYNPDADGSVGNRFTRNLIGKALCNMSFNKSLAIEITNEAGAKIADAMYRIYVLGSEENIFCACSILYNISTIAECRVLTESKAIKLTIDVINSPSSNALSIKLCIATLCNFSLMNVFFDSLMATEVINTFVFVLASPQMHSSMKKDVIQTVYNLVTRCTASRAVFVSCDVVVSLWKYLKAQSGAVLGMAAADGSIESGSISGGGKGGSNGGGSNGDGGDDEAEQDEYVLILIAHVVRELCEELERVLGSGSSSSNSIIIYERKLISDGIMNIILKLSKFELALIKLDMSFCIYSLSKGHEVMKLIKSDAVDIIFWLTLHDTLGMQDTIFANVSRALRCISGRKDEAKALLRQERFLVVFRALIKSKNEDVLWQTAGCMYNLMCVEHCLKLLLDRGLVEFIFEIAASGMRVIIIIIIGIIITVIIIIILTIILDIILTIMIIITIYRLRVCEAHLFVMSAHDP